MRVVFDTNALLSATLWEGSVAEKLLNRLLDTGAEIFISPAILEEYWKVMDREFEFTPSGKKEIGERLCSKVTTIEPKDEVNIVPDDPDDNKIVSCAAAAGAEYIVTYDRHLLRLKTYKKTEILTPPDLLRKLRSSSP